MRTLFTAALLVTAACAQAQPAKPAETPEARAQRILTEAPLADGHNDWPYALRQAYGVEGAKTADLNEPVTVKSSSAFATSAEPMRGHTSIPLLRQGRMGIQIWSVYVPASLSPEDAVKQTFEQIDIVNSFPARHPETFQLALTAAEAEKAWKAGRIASMIGIEGAHQVADDIPTLRRAYAAGARAMTLSHSRPTLLFDSAGADPKHNGMAPGGADMIAEMNRLGMLVDLSHISATTMHAVLDVTKSPVIFSHSSARAIANHPRNVPDDVLKRMPANGGVVMVNFFPAFIDQARVDWQIRRDAQKLVSGQGPEGEAKLKAWDAANPRPVTKLPLMADHIDHIARVAGPDHVGLGADYDGVPDLPVGLENVSTYPALFAELARRGWTDENLRKLAGENYLRVLKANEATAKALASR